MDWGNILDQLIAFFQTPAGVFAGLILLAIMVFGALQALVQLRRALTYLIGHPTYGQITEILLPVVDQAIVAAFKAAEFSLEEFGRKLRGLDKKTLANAIYAYIPDEIVIGGVFKWHPKKWISEVDFEVFVQRRFDEMIALWTENSDQLLDLVREQLGLATAWAGA
jgi:hypothetical protein